jgi:hypothetical protein
MARARAALVPEAAPEISPYRLAERERQFNEAIDSRPIFLPGLNSARLEKAKIAELRGILREGLSGIRPGVASQLMEVRTAVPRDRASNRALAFMYHPPYNAMVIRAKTLRQTPGSARNEWILNNERTDSTGAAWWPKNIPEANAGLKQTVTHELGHFLRNQLTTQQTVALDTAINDYLRTNNVSVAKALSRYGSKSRHELTAEAWAEYKLAPNPRPLAKLVGDTLMGFLGNE